MPNLKIIEKIFWMRGRIKTGCTETDNNQKISVPLKAKGSRGDIVKTNHVRELLAPEGNERFRHYIEWLGLSRDPGLIVLPSKHHYYYDAEEMINVKTVVNLKVLNQIKDINNFFHSMFLILPSRCYLIGCFVDNKKQSGFSLKRRPVGKHPEFINGEIENGISSGIPFLKTLFGFLDLKPNRYLSGKNVSQLLGNNGFRVMDMTDLDGLTHFCARSQRSAEN
jgi:hypothetical protein